MPADQTPAPPLEAILQDLGPVVRDRVLVEDRVFILARPKDSDRLVDHPAVRSANQADDYMPYWADLWPAARMLAKAILQETWSPPGHALEVGCGLGLPGIVALSLGLRVTFSDYDPCALHFAAGNARINGYHDFDLLQLDWRDPPAGLQVPILLASDLVYELRNVAPLVAFIKRVLAPGGLCLLTDQDRIPSHSLRDTLEREGLSYTTRIMRAGEPGGRRLKGTLYRITR
jgi:predicted nicotinamide N-methyase